jgi:hypothetical protein
MPLARQVATVVVLLLASGCSNRGPETSGTAGSTGGVHGFRISEFPWVSCTAGTEELRIVDLALDNCGMSVTWGPAGSLQTTKATCSNAELKSGRSLFSDEKMVTYRAAAVTVDTPNESGQRRAKLIFDSGKGESPSTLLFASDVSSADVRDMLAYFDQLFQAYVP